MPSPATGEEPGRIRRARRGPGPRTGARQIFRRDVPLGTTNWVAGTETVHHVEDGLAPTSDDGLDPAFDEIGELPDHIDRLSARLRLDRTHLGHDDE